MSVQGRSLLAPSILLLLSVGPLQAQATPAPILGKSDDNAASGALGDWDFGATDLTFKATRNEVWVLDSFSPDAPFISVFDPADLDEDPTRILLTLPVEFDGAPVLGIAEITHGDLAGKNLVLIDPTFGGQTAPAPMLGVFEDDGNMMAGGQFAPVLGVDPAARLSSLDVNPVRDEIAVYDITTHQVYLLDFGFQVVGNPIRLLGFPNQFIGPWRLGPSLEGSGSGLTYQGADRLLVSSAFFNGFETHLLLEYDLTNGGLYSGRTMDLSLAGALGFRPDLAFLGMDAGNTGGREVVFAVNFGDDSLYQFGLLPEPSPAPVLSLNCDVLDSGQYQLDWFLDTLVDSVRIVENGVEVAVLEPQVLTYTSPLPLLGKGFVEVVTEKEGVLSVLRPVCQLENTQRPNLPDVQRLAIQLLALGDLLGVAVTKTPATPNDFRGYLVGVESNTVAVFDRKLDFVEVFQPSPPITTVGSNLAALGLAITEIDGEEYLAILDPDGPNDNNIPSAAFYHRTGAQVGQLLRQIDPIDLSRLNPRPFLFDWDSDPDGNFVAGARLITNGDFVVVRLAFDRAQNTLIGTDMAPIPQRELTAIQADSVLGIGVSVLPSGNLLIAGGDSFSRTYTEALLTTGFNADPAKSVKLVGYAQGLFVTNQFFSGFGPGIGPDLLYAMDTAYFAPQSPEDKGVGVTYLPTGDLFLITNASLGVSLVSAGQILVHSENRCSNPELEARQLSNTALQIAAGGQSLTTRDAPDFLNRVKSTDYFYYVMNQSTTDSVQLQVDVSLGGTPVPEASGPVVIAGGRYHRGALLDRAEGDIQVAVTNKGSAQARVKVITGAMGIDSGVTAPRFRRGDCDANGVLELTDPIVGLNYLFLGGPEPSCLDACDTDDTGSVELTDMVVSLNFMFLAGPPPDLPGPTNCGEDPKTDDTLKPCVYSPTLCQ